MRQLAHIDVMELIRARRAKEERWYMGWESSQYFAGPPSVTVVVVEKKRMLKRKLSRHDYGVGNLY